MRTRTLPAEQRKYRTLTQEYFHQLCTEAGGVSSPELLLDYLHHAGIVFYRAGLFDDRIVLDQAWALEAVYAVFHREKCYRQLRQLRGRFTRTLLEALVWRDYRVEEQKLFLSLMKSCGICFVHRQGDREGKLETEYIAPDLLPDREEVEAEIEAMWAEHAPCGEAGGGAPLPAPRCHARHHQPDRAGGGDQRLVLEIRRLSVRKDHPQPRTHRTAAEQSPDHLERPDRGVHPGRPGGGAAPTAPEVDRR